MMVVIAVEISYESAASLIQTVTIRIFQSAPLPGPSCGSTCGKCRASSRSRNRRRKSHRGLELEH